MKKHQQGRPASTMGPDCYPLLFKPVYKDYLWGGTRIPGMFNREPEPGLCAESWEISDRPEGMSIAVNGRHAGKSLHELVLTMGKDLVGEAGSEVFPLLIKLIDAREKLSVQVHPDDRTAERYGGEAKTEMWYVIDAEPDSVVFAGLAPGVKRESFRKALQEERLEEVLRAVPATVGSSIFVPGGRVHAIGEGCLLLEVQQNSNTTYRVYDWGRKGPDGRARDLHIKQAFQCINWRDRASPASMPTRITGPGPNTWWEIMTSPYFHVTRVDLEAPEKITRGWSFDALLTLSGEVAIGSEDASVTTGPGVSCLVPAALTGYQLSPLSDKAVVIRISRD